MTNEIEIRESLPDDIAAIEALYPKAFPDEDLLPVVGELLKPGQPVLSLVAITDGTLAGHVAFTQCKVRGYGDSVSLLAPLAVAPDHQRRGIGCALIAEGFRRLKSMGIAYVYVLGDPAYYARAGFEAETRIAPPFAIPEEWLGAWQSICLDVAAQLPDGDLLVPPPWDQKELWAP